MSLANRLDKRDVWALASSVTGFDFRYEDGVVPEDIPEKALPAVRLEKMAGTSSIDKFDRDGGLRNGRVQLWHATGAI